MNELTYDERLTIRRALEFYAAAGNDQMSQLEFLALFPRVQQNERAEAERLQWLIKDAAKVIVERGVEVE